MPDLATQGKSNVLIKQYQKQETNKKRVIPHLQESSYPLKIFHVWAKYTTLQIKTLIKHENTNYIASKPEWTPSMHLWSNSHSARNREDRIKSPELYTNIKKS